MSLILLAFVTALCVVSAPSAELLGGVLGNTLSREPQVHPADLGAGAFAGLMDPNPAEGVDLVDAPASNNQGTAQLSHPLSIPAGRGGFQPDLSVDYDSSNGSSWVGTGWDLSFGDVTVDTEWGVPRYLADKESETYLLDGARLSPTAVRSNLQPRVSERHDFAPRVDTSYEHIVRHGDNPTNYWWEVTDKLGGKRWYGGVPDCGGPDGYERGRGQSTEPTAALQRDPSAILADANGNGYRWALSAQRDVGGNLIRYFYDKVTTHPWGASGPSGTQLYISKIRYTGWATGDCTAADIPDFTPQPPEDEAYEIRFLRDAQITPTPTPRKDIIVDGKGGFLQVTADLLRRVEVYHGIPTSPDVVFRSSRTAYTQLVRRYDFNYIEGAFGKSLLSSIDQIGSDGNVYATNRFDYFDDVRPNGTTYTGFDQQNPAWDSGSDGLTKNLITDVGSSVLGSTESNSGDVHAYIGFNPLDPEKIGSFGGALTIKGGATEATSEFIDLNGDQLPDKVFRKTRGGPVQYRLNTSGPDDGVAKFDTTDPPHTVANLSTLSTEFNIGVAGGVEAYPVASIQFSLAGEVTVGEDYFTDVNNDGLVDFVSAGKVYFNHLEHVGNDLIPTFSTDSSLTDVPVDDGTANLPAIQALADVEAQNRAQSPLQDTVRRWVAPFAGVVSIDAPITFDSPPDTRSPVPPYDGDGVRATIQRGADELWAAALVTPGTTATPSGVSDVHVAAGQAIYFRLQSIDNGFRDQVRWSPEVTYTSYTNTAETPVADVNALSQKVFKSADDFTLAGRPGTTVLMPLEGTAHFDATLHKTRATTDDVKVLVLKNGVPVISQVIAAATVDAAGIPISADIPIAAPSGSTADKIEVRLAVDSPIDVTALSWTPRLYYTSATSGGNPVPVVDKDGNRTLELVVPADIEIYPQTTLDAPSKPWHSDLGRAVDAYATVDTFGAHAGGRVTLTVKQRGVLVGKTQLNVAAGQLSATDHVNVTLRNNEDYWFDLTVHDNPCTASISHCKPLSERITASSVQLRWNDGGAKTRDVPSTRYWAGSQGIFPISYRGWGYAGYKGEGNRASAAIDETAFVIDTANFPTTSPTGLNDPNYHNPADADAYAFTPYQLQLRNAQDQVTGAVPVWRGVKDNIVGGADFARASRRGVDDPSVAGATAGSGVRAVRQVSVSAPTVSLAGGLVVNAAFAAGPSFGVLNYTDMNGDGFPDIVAPGYISYTGPRGGYTNQGSGVDPVSQDVTFSVGAGFGGSPLEISANSKGDANTAQNTRASSASPSAGGAASAAAAAHDASADEYGVSIGGSFGITAAFTNPVTSPSSTPSSITTAPLEHELADVNGDGLPDQVIADPGGIRVKFNLGYGFTSESADFSGGGFEAGENYSGSIGGTLGFSGFAKDFSAGLAYNESDSIPRYSWVDVDGDGVLDRLRRDGSEIKVAFGTGAGIMDEVTYGTFADGNIQLVGQNIPIGQQIAQDRTVGLGGGFDFTIGVGPLCIVACYLIINPGVHFDHSISNSTVQLEDVNGDGYPDSVRSDTDSRLDVHLNTRRRTNLLKTVHNPLGGSIALDYRRDGNTVDQPNSQWVLKSEVVDDGRPGDGADTSLTTFDYSGGRFDRLERESLGYAKVTERQRSFQNDGNVDDDPLLRSIEHNFLNSTIFDSGLETSQRLIAPGNVVLHETLTDWGLFDLNTGQPANTGQSGGGAAGVARLQLAVGPLARSIEQRWYDDSGVLGEQTKNTYAYLPAVAGPPATLPWRDLSRGNVIRQVDGGQTETTSDDVTADITYTQCRSRTDNPALDYTWVSVPDTLRVTDSHGNVLRSSDATKHNMVDYNGDGVVNGDDDPGTLCDNQSITRLDQGIDGDLLTPASSAARDTARCQELTSGPACATTELSYDEWGSYGDIRYPANAAGDRLGVNYVYDSDRHSDIASTIDSHGLESKATYDGRTGRITSRTDENGQTTSYTYDPFGRIASITGPYEQGSGHATVTFDYHLGAPYAYAVAHHFDVFHPGDPIDKAVFVDGIGRTTQTQQDASIFNGANTPSATRLVVSGAEEYDALGRTINKWYPFAVPPGQLGTFQSRAANPPAVSAATATDWNLRDQITKVTAPNGAVTQTAYGFGGQADFGARLFTRTETDALGKSQRLFVDARSNVIASDDVPVGAPVMRTRYDYDPLGQLSTVTDTGANVSRFTYDLLGRRTSGRTPDGGLVETHYDASDNITSKVTPNLRAAGRQISYTYDFERLTGIHYSDGTPDVTYTYGTDADKATNGAGRVIGVLDGVRSQTLAYDALGQIADDKSTMLVHNLNDSTEARVTFQTQFTYDGFGRIRTMTYPDGEGLTYGYDSGGLLSSIDGVKAGLSYRYLDRREYDEFFDRRFQKVGNDTQTTYQYDPQTRFLARQLTDAPTRKVQDFNYTYDLVGNVKRVVNDLPAPKPGLMGGPSTQNYRYDPYYRLLNADGTYAMAPGKRRDYTYGITYDANSNIASKAQTDIITEKSGSKTTQKFTTYSLPALTYSAAKPHVITQIGTRSYTNDADGNFTGWTDSANGQNRSATWDAENRMTSVADQGATTTFKYDQSGERGISRGPGGELAFVNRWYTVHNGSEAWKEIWAGEDRLATQRSFDDGTREFMRYFLHKDLQGSTNIVTDDTGLVFQHAEYFPSGEIWVEEHSDVHRTPYLYAGGYFDEWRNLTDLGARWYEPREQFMYSADPVLESDPAQLIDDPALSPAYSYAESNPLRLVDPDGRRPSAARQAFSNAFGRAANSFKQWGRIQPGSAASRRLVGGWGSRLAGITPRTSDRLRTIGQRFNGISERDGVTSEFEVPAFISISLGKTASGWKVEKVELLGHSLLKQSTAPPSPAPAAAPAVAPPAAPVAPAAAAPNRPTRPLPAPPVARRARAASAP